MIPPTLPKYKSWTATPAFCKELRWHRFKLKVKANKGGSFMGRLGGGWLWKLSLLWGGTECVLELFVVSIQVSWSKSNLEKK